jgi:hypothetical protein
MKTLQSIPVVGWIIDKTPHMDFEGQKLAETIYRSVIILFSVRIMLMTSFVRSRDPIGGGSDLGLHMSAV